MANDITQTGTADAPTWAAALRKGHPRWWMVLLIACVGAAVHVAVNGYAFGGCTVKPLVTSLSGDHANVLPWVYWYQDNSLFPHDLQIQSGAAYATIFWRLVAWLGRVIPVPYVFFGLHIAALIGTYAALFRLGSLLGENAWAGAAACALFLVARDAPAGEATHDPALYTRMAALPLVLASVHGALRARPIQTFGLLAAAVAVHLLTAFYAAPVILGIWLFSDDMPDGRRLGWVVGFLVASIAIAALIGGGTGITLGHPSAAWLDLQKGNNVMHLFPSLWAATVWRDAAYATAFLFLPIIALTTPALRRFAIIVVLSCGVLALTGWLFAEKWPSMFIMQLQPLRGLKIGMILAYVVGAAWLCRQKSPLVWILAAASIAAWLTKYDRTFVGLMIAVLPAGFLTWKSGLHAYRVAAMGIAALLVVATGFAVWQGTQETNTAANGQVTRRYRPPLEFPWKSEVTPWVDVQRWVAQNAPTAAAFITPPSLEGFRTHSKRSEWADWKQGTLSLFNEKFGMEWRNRLGRIAGRSGDPRAHIDLFKSYNSLSADDLRALAAEYGMTHAVTMTPVQGLTPLYSNRVFWVYSLR